MKKQHFSIWMEHSQKDLSAAKKLITGNNPLIYPTLFHTQQAAEKALKSYLISKKQSSRIHNLLTLTKRCKRFDTMFNDIRKDAATLTPFYIEARYPDETLHIEPTVSVARKCISIAEKIILFVAERLP